MSTISRKWIRTCMPPIRGSTFRQKPSLSMVVMTPFHVFPVQEATRTASPAVTTYSKSVSVVHSMYGVSSTSVLVGVSRILFLLLVLQFYPLFWLICQVGIQKETPKEKRHGPGRSGTVPIAFVFLISSRHSRSTDSPHTLRPCSIPDPRHGNPPVPSGLHKCLHTNSHCPHH